MRKNHILVLAWLILGISHSLQADLTARNIASTGQRPTSSSSVYQRHVDGKIWVWDGKSKCTTDACPGWILIDRNERTKDIATARGTLFQRHVDGKVWVWDGTSRCTTDACPGWTLIDRNTRTEAIAGDFSRFYQRHVDGKIWVWDGQSKCITDACPGWTLIDRNERTKDIVVARETLFQRHVDGKVWVWDGKSQCTADACPGWTLIDRNTRTEAIAGDRFGFYQRHVDGKVWVWDGTSRCITDACPGWTLIDRNERTKDIAAAIGTLFQRHVDGKIWVWDGQSRCTTDACPGWTLIDRNTRTEAIAGGHYGRFYQRHVDGKVWVWDGTSRCITDACPGWRLLDRNERTKDIAAGGGVIPPKTLELRPVEELGTGRSGKSGSEGVCFSRGRIPEPSFSAGPGQMMVGFDNFFVPGTNPFPCHDIRAAVFRGGVRFDLSMFDNISSARLQFDTQRSIFRIVRDSPSAQSPPISHATILGVATQAFSPQMLFDNGVALPTTSFVDLDVSSQVRAWVHNLRVNFGFVVAGPTGLVDPDNLPRNNDARLSFYGNFRLLVTFDPVWNPRAPQ